MYLKTRNRCFAFERVCIISVSAPPRTKISESFWSKPQLMPPDCGRFNIYRWYWRDCSIALRRSFVCMIKDDLTSVTQVIWTLQFKRSWRYLLSRDYLGYHMHLSSSFLFTHKHISMIWTQVWRCACKANTQRSFRPRSNRSQENTYFPDFINCVRPFPLTMDLSTDATQYQQFLYF